MKLIEIFRVILLYTESDENITYVIQKIQLMQINNKRGVNRKFNILTMVFSLKKFLLLFILSFFGSISNAQSIIQMQHDYDEMREKISSTKIEIPCLEADKISANYIKRLVYTKLLQLDSSLVKTKNYKQADEKYNTLMRTLEDDPEYNAIVTNYNEFKEAESLRIELVKNNSMTLAEFENWKKTILEKYKALGGANFQGRTGQYNSMSDLILNN